MNYLWSPSTGISNTAIANPTVTSSTPGTTTYTVLVTNPSNGCTKTDQVVVEVKPIPASLAGTDVNFVRWQCRSGCSTCWK